MQDNLESFLGLEEKKVKSNHVMTSCEGDYLRFWGSVFLWLGIVIAIGCVIASGLLTKEYDYQGWGDNGFYWPLFIVAGGALVQGLIVKLFLNAFYEIIKLLARK